MTDIRLPSEVLKLLKAAKVKNIDMYAGRRVRNGAGKVHYKSSNGNGAGPAGKKTVKVSRGASRTPAQPTAARSATRGEPSEES